ncbi:hypothetical protein HYV79_05450 [Candidatus Woesearchaeota archaeon]|nr:hypothetical protein [Candidatus Woesearchaeota archaeon]
MLFLHLGEGVTVTFVDQFNKQESITGTLVEVNPYFNIEISSWEKWAGKKYKSITGIPFLGSPDAIMSIVTETGRIIYDNENVHPFYNPFFFPNTDKNGTLCVGINYDAGKAHTKKVRKLSFGDKKLLMDL